MGMARLLTLLVVTAVAGSLAVAAQDLPEGEGKALVVQRCSSCHGVDSILPLKLSREEWAPVVTRMLDYGAFLDEKETATTLDYLSAHFGPAKPAESSPAPAAAGAATEADKTAQRYLGGVCVSCHAADVIETALATKAGWVDILNNMNGKGAGLSDADVDLLADYLARTYLAQ
jgi:mono/diheme cytochrome c family protein